LKKLRIVKGFSKNEVITHESIKTSTIKKKKLKNQEEIENEKNRQLNQYIKFYN
jgi:hypothetical protein